MEQWLIDYSEYLLFIIIPVAFALLLIRQRNINSAPEYTAIATVISKRTEPGRFHGKWSSGWNYLVTFQFGNDTIELYVSEMEYQSLAEGMSGLLRWQNENLCYFDPQK